MRWHCPSNTGFEIRALAVWGRARYLSITEAPNNTEFYTWMGEKHFCFFQTAVTGNRTPNSNVKGSGANHYPRSPVCEFQTKYTLNSTNDSILVCCWPSVADNGPTVSQHWVMLLCLLGKSPALSGWADAAILSEGGRKVCLSVCLSVCYTQVYISKTLNT